MTDDQRSESGGTTPEPGPVPDFGEAMVTPSQDTVFELLAKEQRRHLCQYLSGTDERILSLTEIAEAVAPRVESSEERLAVTLHHQHLPKLDGAGMVDYDSRSKTVRYRGQPSIEKWAADAVAITEE